MTLPRTVSGKPILSSETKTLKIVRTIGGARRYQQPKGSIIVRDGSNPLDALVAMPNDRPGFEKVADLQGNVYYVGHIGDKWVIESGLDGSKIKELETSEDAFTWLNNAAGGSEGPKPKTPPNPIPSGPRDTARMRVIKGELGRPEYALTIAQGSSLGVLNESEIVLYRQYRDRGLDHTQAYKLSREGKPSGGPPPSKKKSMVTEEQKVHGHRTLERAPGKNDNWVESAGGLPAYIEHIAQALHERQGMTISHAIATAVNRVKRWSAGLDNVTPATRAKAIAALAQWEALKAKSKLKK